MTKIVYNVDYGGFGLSNMAIHRYAELKGIVLYPEIDQHHMVTYWLVPAILRPEGDWEKMTDAERVAFNEAWHRATFDDRAISRTDPILVQVVEELGCDIAGTNTLGIAKLPPGTKYRIDEYDGRERIMTIDDYEWSVA